MVELVAQIVGELVFHWVLATRLGRWLVTVGAAAGIGVFLWAVVTALNGA